MTAPSLNGFLWLFRDSSDTIFGPFHIPSSCMEHSCKRQVITPVVLTTALVCLLWYLSLLAHPAAVGNSAVFVLLLVAELIAAIQLLGAWITIIVGPDDAPRDDILVVKKTLQRNPKLAGDVAVFVPVSGEPIEVITETLVAARDISFPHRTYVLDDGMSAATKELANRLGIGYLRRPDRSGWKAGNINNALQNVECDFFAIFDSDHVAKQEFLIETLPWLLADKDVAFVQTPQYLVNRDSFVGGGIAESQEIFYNHIQPCKSRFNAAFCVGTNVLFRTAAVLEVGGMYDKSRSEDIWTSLLLHEAGWRSVYLPLVLAHGQAPETVESFLRQQFRWASGGYEILFKKNPMFIRAFTLDQKLQYMHTALFFLSGVSVAIFYILPLLYVYFGWRAMDVAYGGWNWAAHFVPAFAMMYLSTAHLLGRWPRWRTYVVAIGAFPAHICACMTVLTGVRLKWKPSGVATSNIDYIKPVMIHLLLLLLSLSAIPVLLMTERNAAMALLMCMWLVLNGFSLFSLCRRAIPQRGEPAIGAQPTYSRTAAA